MSTKYIQFRGIKDVMNAYNMRDIDAWAIFNGKEMFTKGSGSQELEQFLTMLQNSSCTYTLKVYEDVTDLKTIKDKTPSDGAFSFKLCEEEEDFGPYTYTNKKNKLIERIERLEQLGSINEEDEEEETLEDVMIGAIKEPWKIAELVNTVKGIFGIQPGYVPQNNMATMGAITQGQQQPQSEEMLNRLETAINTLEKYDENIIFHLEKLAKIAQANPSQFNFLIKALENM